MAAMPHAVSRYWPAILAAGLLTLGGCTAGPPREEVSKGNAPAPTTASAVPRVPQGWPFPLDRPAAEGEHGMVVADQALATQVGVDVLRRGGNAVDAAVATAFALAVTFPTAGNIGGGGFMVPHIDGQVHALDFRETAPAGAAATCTSTRTATTPIAAYGSPRRGRAGQRRGALGGPPDARLEALGRLVAAGDPARGGGVRGRRLRRDRHRGQRPRHARGIPASAALFLPAGSRSRGVTWKNPELAGCCGASRKGPRGFYKGETADLIARRDEARRGAHHA